MPQVKMTDEAQIYVIQRLACFGSPAEVLREVKELFDVEISLPGLLHYDPTKAQGRDLSEDLTTLFQEIRERFRNNTADIPIANKSVRLEYIQRVAEKAEKQNKHVLVLAANKAAREEMEGTGARRQADQAGAAEPAATGNQPNEQQIRDIHERAAELAKLPADELMLQYRIAIGAVGAD